MTQRKRSSGHRSSRTRSHPILRSVTSFWSAWRVEVVIVLVIAFALFLLIERMSIRQTLLGWLRGGLQWLGDLLAGAIDVLSGFVRNTTLSNLLGILLLIGAAVLVVWRLRWRLVTMPRFTERRCPRCDGDLHRVHRRQIDRAVNLFVPVRRYQCKDRDCRWQGLRVGRSRHE